MASSLLNNLGFRVFRSSCELRMSCEGVLWIVLSTEGARIELPYHVLAIRFRNRHKL